MKIELTTAANVDEGEYVAQQDGPDLADYDANEQDWQRVVSARRTFRGIELTLAMYNGETYVRVGEADQELWRLTHDDGEPARDEA